MFVLPGKTNRHVQTHECVIPRSGKGVYLSLCYIIKKRGEGRDNSRKSTWPRDFADIIHILLNLIGIYFNEFHRNTW